MKRSTKNNVKKNIANLFGSFGYLFCFLQWFWVIMLYFSVIKLVAMPLVPHVDKHVEQMPQPTYTPPTSLEVIILVAVVVIMIAVTIYALVKMPISLVKTSNKAVHKTVDTIVPVIVKAQHKKDTEKNRIKLTSELMIAAKLLLMVVPLILTAASGLLEKQQPIDYPIAITLGAGAGCLSLIFFAIQYILARLLHVQLSDLK